jgi:hypothetical protein
MIDAMFDLPSNDMRELLISLSYAKEKIEKTNVGRLKAA